MCKVFIKDINNEVVKVYDDCFKVTVIPELEMMEKYGTILELYDLYCSYFLIVDSLGSHFYPLFCYSAEIG